HRVGEVGNDDGGEAALARAQPRGADVDDIAERLDSLVDARDELGRDRRLAVENVGDGRHRNPRPLGDGADRGRVRLSHRTPSLTNPASTTRETFYCMLGAVAAAVNCSTT